MRKKSILFFVSILLLLSGCKTKSVKNNNEIEAAYKQFINQFSKEYPDFMLLDSTMGSSENDPILLVGVGKNKNDGTSSTLFVVDDNGVGKIVLASDNKGIYIKEDGLVLDKNVILVSLKLIGSKQNEEIHDFRITVTRQNNDTLYSSEEIIRKK